MKKVSPKKAKATKKPNIKFTPKKVYTFACEIEATSPYTRTTIIERLNQFDTEKWSRQKYHQYITREGWPFHSLESYRMAAGIQEERFYETVRSHSIPNDHKG